MATLTQSILDGQFERRAALWEPFLPTQQGFSQELADMKRLVRLALERRMRESASNHPAAIQAPVMHAVPEPLGGVSESSEMRWLSEHSDLLRTYSGQWLLVVDNEVAAHSENFADITRTISERGIRSPFVYYVPTDDESNFLSI